MGFLNPGQSRKRRATQHKKAIDCVKRAQTRSISPESASYALSHTKITKTTVVEKPRSILERLPIEVIHEVFILAGLNSLPFVCKSLCHELTPTTTLRADMLERNVYDLNSGIPEITGFKTQYALDKKVLDYKFITAEALKRVKFDTVLSLETINAEKKNRLVLHCDKLNKMMLDTMKRAESTEDEIKAEIERISAERERLELDDVELSDLALEQVQDFPERFYTGGLDEPRLSVFEELHHRSMKFMDPGRIISAAIDQGHDTRVIERLLACTESASIRESAPLISAFQRNDLELVAWLLSKCEDATAMVNDDDLWVYLSERQKAEYMHFLEQRGGVPSSAVLSVIAAAYRG